MIDSTKIINKDIASVIIAPSTFLHNIHYIVHMLIKKYRDVESLYFQSSYWTTLWFVQEHNPTQIRIVPGYIIHVPPSRHIAEMNLLNGCSPLSMDSISSILNPFIPKYRHMWYADKSCIPEHVYLIMVEIYMLRSPIASKRISRSASAISACVCISIPYTSFLLAH